MKYFMCRFVTGIILIFLSSNSFSLGQSANGIKETAISYAESRYSGNIEKFAEAVHPSIREVKITRSQITGENIFNLTSYGALVENIRGNDTMDSPPLSVEILQSDPTYANIRLACPEFRKYLQLININGHWKVVNVLSGLNEKMNLSAGEEKNTIKNSAKKFLDGVIGGDAYYLKLSIFKEFCSTTLGVNNKTGKTFINRSGSSSIIEGCLNKAGVLDEPMRKYKIKVLDVMGEIASVEAISPSRVFYLQMIKTGSGWKVLNSIRRANPEYSFTDNSPVYLGEPMPGFTLPLFDGGEFNLSEKRGKKIMLIFLRGRIGNIWCPLCQYQYNELVQLEKQNHWRKKYNMEIYFVLPYSKERIEDWFANFGTAKRILKNWKNLKGPKDFVQFVNHSYPLDFKLIKGQTEKMFPVIMDENREVSRRFKLYTTFWDGIKSEQNISTIYILNEKGIVDFKYFSQQTQDRPTYKYLMNFVDKMD